MSISVGTAGGSKDVSGISVGTAGGNKTVLDGWVGTPDGNKKFYSSALNIAAAATTWTEIDPVEEKPGDEYWFANVSITSADGTGPYTYLWSQLTGAAIDFDPYSETSALISYSGPISCTFVCTVTDSLGASGVSNVVAL